MDTKVKMEEIKRKQLTEKHINVLFNFIRLVFKLIDFIFGRELYEE